MPTRHRPVAAGGDVHAKEVSPKAADADAKSDKKAPFLKYHCRLGSKGDDVAGFFAWAFMLTAWIAGSFWPVTLYIVYALFGYVCAALLGAFMALPFLVRLPPSPLFVRCILRGASWFKGGATMWLEDSLDGIDFRTGTLWTSAPHGVFPYSFILNGSARIIANRGVEETHSYLPELLQRYVQDPATGCAEPLLFKIPLIRMWTQLFGCVEPAARHTFRGLLKARRPFGLLPGGSEEIILNAHGRERIFIKHRKGFIKYALTEGYTVVVGYNFGESDTYWCWNALERLRLTVLKRYKVPLFFSLGTWWCPVLPRRETGLNTVYGSPIRLPRIEHPTEEDVAHWHAVYMQHFTDLFERYKHKFGYGDRTLEIH